MKDASEHKWELLIEEGRAGLSCLDPCPYPPEGYYATEEKVDYNLPEDHFFSSEGKILSDWVEPEWEDDGSYAYTKDGSSCSCIFATEEYEYLTMSPRPVKVKIETEQYGGYFDPPDYDMWVAIDEFPDRTADPAYHKFVNDGSYINIPEETRLCDLCGEIDSEHKE